MSSGSGSNARSFKRRQDRTSHEVRMDGRLRYNTLRVLDSRFMKWLVVTLVSIYMAVGLLAVVFDVGLVCIQPRLREVSTHQLDVLSLPNALIATSRRQTSELQPQWMLPALADGHTKISRKLQMERVGDLQLAREAAHQPDELPAEDITYLMLCAPPYSRGWIRISIALNCACLCISVTLLLEHATRMACVSMKYFLEHPWLRIDVVAVGVCVCADLTVLLFLRPRLLNAWREGATNLHATQAAVTCFRFIRLLLLFRVVRAVRSEWHPGTEIARTIEVMDVLKSDMPNINIKSVQVVKNRKMELRLFEEQKAAIEEYRGYATEKTLFFGAGETSPQSILDNDQGLDSRFATAGEVGHALYGAERPSYADSCLAHTDWESDPSGHTKQLVVYQALVGESQDLEFKMSRSRRRPDTGFDSVCFGPVFPGQYVPEEIGLDRRDVSSTIYALYDTSHQALVTAVITYENPDSFEEIDRLLGTFQARSWPDYLELVPSSNSDMGPEQAGALRSLGSAIETRSVEAYEECRLKCERLGVPELEISHLQRQKKQDSEEAGVSLAYILSDEFLELAQRETGKDDPTFIEMKDPLFIDGPARQGEGRLCPRDLRPNCSFVDVLPPEHRGPATNFMSWVWRYRLSTVRDGLRRWAERNNLDPSKVFLFVCFFCNNQWRMLVEQSSQGSDNLEVVFEARLKKIGNLVAVMDAWEDAIYIQRIWTIYEQYVASQLGIEVQFTLPAEPAATMLEQLDKGKEGIKRVIETISHVNAETAQATMEADAIKVKSLIRKSKGGFLAVNEQVKSSITQWVASEFRAHIDRLVHAP